jgi:protein SCO1/2
LLRTLLASAVAIALGIAALATATDGFRAFTTESARRVFVARKPVAVRDAVLETERGARVALADLRGRWLAVDFVYTRCATYCSAQGATFARVQRLLAQPIADGRVRLVSISFDPAHDTAAELAGYLRRSGGRGDGWLATRPVDDVALASLLQDFAVVVIPDGSGGYVHNDGVHLVDPDGRIVAIVDGDDPNAIASALTSSLESTGRIPSTRARNPTP